VETGLMYIMFAKYKLDQPELSWALTSYKNSLGHYTPGLPNKENLVTGG